MTRRTVGLIVAELAVAIVALMGCQIVIGMPMIWLLGKHFALPIWTLVYYILSYALAGWVVFWAAPKLWQKFAKERDLYTDKEELGINKWPTFVDIGLAPIGYIVYIVLAQVLTNVMMLLPWFNVDEAQDVGFSYLGGFGDKIIAFIALVVIAPIVEEVIMRGWLYGKVRNKLKMIPAMLLISLVFGALHGQWNVAVTTFAMSMVLCSMREMTGSIWSGVLLHMLSNGIAFYFLYSL